MTLVVREGAVTKRTKLGPLPVEDLKPHRLKLVMADGRVGLYTDDILRFIINDPLAGEAGSPGLYTESASVASRFSARRTK